MAGRNRLKELREERRLTQMELAVLSGVSIRTIARMEAGEVTPHGATAIKLITALSSSKRKVTLDELLGLRAAV